jgi:PadR family transcriptional regulator PadR
MHDKDDYKRSMDLLQGTLDLIILQTLKWGPQHGYGLSQAIKTDSRAVLQVDTGSLYPALHRLEKRRLVKSEWKTSENNQRAKYYRLTAAGQKKLANETSRWNQLVEAMSAIMARRENEV